MARIRTIKPEFFTSEDVVSLSPLARLLYIGVWCEADKEGRLHWKPNTLKLRYLPGDTCDIHALCAELTERGMVVLYGDGLAHVPAFRKHQHINPREAVSRLPAPDADAWSDRASPLSEADAHAMGGHAPANAPVDASADCDDAPACVTEVTPRDDDAPAPDDDASARVPHASARVPHASARVPHAQGGREGKGRERNISPNGEIARARATRLPPDWVLPDDWRCWAAAERPDLDLDRTAAVFADHWRSAAGQRGVKADWLATWRNWVRNERTSPRAAGPPTSRGAESFRERGERMAAERVAQFAPAAADRAAMGPRSVAAVLDVEVKEIGNVVAIGSR